ncbi:MAG: DNA topoisomerase IV subunit B [Planctomycetaceae bacterium]
MSTVAPPKSASTYRAADIEVLEGLEAVRRRPSMYIGGVDARGLHHLLWEILDNSVDEFLAGHNDRIEVTLHKDGSGMTVRDWGRGIPVDKHPKFKKSALEIILCTLHAGGKFSDKNYARSGGLHGVGSSVVNALSASMVATVHRDGHEWVQSYKRGVPAGPVEKVKPFRGSGTTIYFQPDAKVFNRTHFSPEIIKQHLEDISYIHAGLKIKFTDESKNETVEYSAPDGIKSYLAKIVAESKKRPVHEPPLFIARDERGVKVEVAFQWTEAPEETVRSYVNGIRTHAGGTHESGLKAGIAKAVKNYIDVHDIKIKGVQLSSEDIREGVTAILSVFHGDPMFQGQTKEKLNNPDVAGIVDGLVRPNLETWLNNNPSVADAIVGRIVLAARARAASRAAASEVRRKGPGGKKTNLPGKLLDCRSRERDNAELFIVEGDSAGGTAAMGRDGSYQAVLPLRGKILNTESLSLTKAMQNQEVKDLCDALGTGVGQSFDLHKLRYDKVILLMDADSDGYHISTLLLAFFFRHLPEIVRAGKLYLAQPPLYKITIGNDVQYARDDAQKEELLEKAAKNRKIDVQRFKGLGEMDAEQLRDTTLDPKKRVLLRVDVESQLDADTTLQQLLGKDASERYRIIMAEASFADDLDL